MSYNTQVEPKDQKDFQAFLKNLNSLGYVHYNETSNHIYRQFLF
jgi:hypothetical protein